MKRLTDAEIVRVAGWFAEGRVHWRLRVAALVRTCEEIEARNGREGLDLFLAWVP